MGEDKGAEDVGQVSSQQQEGTAIIRWPLIQQPGHQQQQQQQQQSLVTAATALYDCRPTTQQIAGPQTGNLISCVCYRT